MLQPKSPCYSPSSCSRLRDLAQLYSSKHNQWHIPPPLSPEKDNYTQVEKNARQLSMLSQGGTNGYMATTTLLWNTATSLLNLSLSTQSCMHQNAFKKLCYAFSDAA